MTLLHNDAVTKWRFAVWILGCFKMHPVNFVKPSLRRSVVRRSVPLQTQRQTEPHAS